MQSTAVTSIFGDSQSLNGFYGFLSNNGERLSFAQCAEIYSTNPEATLCMTYDEWHTETERRIKRGSKGIPVFDEARPSRKVYLFDIGQTYGNKSYRTTPAMTDGQLLDAIKSQCLWSNEISGSYRDRLYAAVSDYCDNVFGGLDDDEDNENILTATKEGVFTCLIHKFNKPAEYILSEGYTELNIEKRIDVAANVTRLSNRLFNAIANYRRFLDAKHTQKPSKQETEAATEIKSEQQSFFSDLQIRETETDLFKRQKTGNILRPSFNGQVNSALNTNGNAIETTQRDADERTSQVKPNSTDYGLFRESSEIKSDRGTSGRASALSSDLHDYRLTEDNFSNYGGAKTRYKNNIAAIKLIRELETTNEPPTNEQKAILAKYIGWGGLAQAFDEQNNDWVKEYAELKDLLTIEEYKSAKGSTLSAHYTPKTVIDAIYSALGQMGFKDGRLLEPAMGTGHFLGLMPETFKSQRYGVEIDPMTGKIAKHLYPNADIQVKGFEDTDFPNNYFDGVVTNVPFGSFKVHDPLYNKHDLFIHNYFILKSLDKLRAGGIAAFVTTKGTMDKANPEARKLFAQRAELLGAIRLPNNAFKENAGTEVTTDILFFRKRETMVSDSNDEWLNIGQTGSGILLNQYFVNNTHMVLGEMKVGKSMYGSDDETFCEPDGRDLKESLSEVIYRYLPKNLYIAKKANVEQGISTIIPADLSVKNFCFSVAQNNKIYLRINEEMVLQEIPKTNEARLKAMIGLRQQVRKLLNFQIGNCTDEILVREQAQLNDLYDNFVKQYGYLNTRTNKNLFRPDADYTLLVSLENYDEINNTATKADIFSKRTIREYVRPKSADTALEALQICKNETGKVDIRIIEELTSKSFDAVTKELKGYIYRNPTYVTHEDRYAGWETATEYLSGNVKEKLRFAKAVAETNLEYADNVIALEKVQPEPLSASAIKIRLGANWIPEDIYKQFIIEKFQINYWGQQQIQTEYNHFNSYWRVALPDMHYRTLESNSTYGTSRMNGFKIMEHALNLQTPSIYDTIIVDGKEKREFNRTETIAAREKLRKLQEDFKAWIFDDPIRRTALVELYNEKFNNIALARYDGSYLTFPEMNPLIELRDYQKNAVERIITGGNTLLHHVVGAGKSFEIAAAAMKLRQLKLAQKPMIIVPNHLVMQWANEFRTLYPNAKLLIATKKDFEKENRLKFVSRIATGDWDAVVMAMSSFEKIPISKERQERKINEEIDSIESALTDLRTKKESRISVKIMEKIIKNKQAQLKDLATSNKDDLIKFEDLGVDYLFVDEAHKWKNKFIFTKMNNVRGISRAMSKRSTDLDLKIDYITELHGGAQKGIVFATGTPISNSMTEMYTMKSYLAKQDLLDAGLKYFDSWAATFGETVTGLELAPSGQGYRSITRFSKFTNLPELLKMYRTFADVKTAEMLKLPVPKANRHVVTIKPTDTILEINKLIAERADDVQNRKVSPDVDNMLKITSDGKKLALDPRCYDRTTSDDPKHKINICVDNVYRKWDETKGRQGTQIIFCDLSTPKKAFSEYDPEKDFDVYNHIKHNLVNMGIPQNEIAFIHDAKNDIAKQTLFDNVRAGKIRILLGSTEKCGAGTNVQNKLVALHHLDTPYRPSDLEQRDGRGIRPGNTNKEIDIFTYVTERTFDAYCYQILENKQRFISQINNGELTVREADDIDETTLSYAEIKAITSANPLIKRKFEVETELGNLRVLQSQYRSERYAMQDKITRLPEVIDGLTKKISDYEKDISVRNENKSTDFLIHIADRPYTERKDAAELL